jgi:hypothetical protein
MRDYNRSSVLPSRSEIRIIIYVAFTVLAARDSFNLGFRHLPNDAISACGIVLSNFKVLRLLEE